MAVIHKTLQIGLTIIGLYIFIQAFMAIANFIGLSFDNYINYLLWILALVLFWIFLPKRVGFDLFK